MARSEYADRAATPHFIPQMLSLPATKNTLGHTFSKGSLSPVILFKSLPTDRRWDSSRGEGQAAAMGALGIGKG